VYYYEVFILKEEVVPTSMSDFKKTGETRFHAVYEAAIPDGNCYIWDSIMQGLQHENKISFFYWAFIPKAKEL